MYFYISALLPKTSRGFFAFNALDFFVKLYNYFYFPIIFSYNIYLFL